MDKAIVEKLDLLYKIQKIDSEIDSIERLKGELPQELEDLKDRLIGYSTRINKIEDIISEFKKNISDEKINSDQAGQLMIKYQEQQKTIKNNREFDALKKEIELKDIEKKLSEKKIKEYKEEIGKKEEDIKNTNSAIKEQKVIIDLKKKELELITKENALQEKNLVDKKQKLEKKLDANLLQTYKNLRTNLRNRLAVVMVHREACGGCFNIIAPQRQVDIRAKNKIIVCEHCGRILSGIDEEKENTKETSNS